MTCCSGKNLIRNDIAVQLRHHSPPSHHSVFSFTHQKSYSGPEVFLEIFRERESEPRSGDRVQKFALCNAYTIPDSFASARTKTITNLFTHNNGDFGAISVTERTCAPPISTVGSPVCTYRMGGYYTRQLFVRLREKSELKFIDSSSNLVMVASSIWPRRRLSWFSSKRSMRGS